MEDTYDFGGWATRNDLVCADGRIIRRNAFQVNDGQKVPLVWNHKHDGVVDVLGHALLENREEGVYAYGTFNDTESGQTAKLLVQHGDVDALSIYANNLKQNMANVIHGDIKEVSLVLAGANPGAFIESVIRHGEESEEECRSENSKRLPLPENQRGNRKKSESRDASVEFAGISHKHDSTAKTRQGTAHKNRDVSH